jgi:ABC-type glycerol-3-phosphate transport system permease component
MLRQFFRTIPTELEDAALIDGASRPRIFFQIILPLARPALVVLIIQAILYNWNNFLQPLIYLTNRDLYTLSLGVNSLAMFMPGVPDTVHYQMALSTLMVLPPVVLYFVAQRAFVRGIVLTGLKG